MIESNDKPRKQNKANVMEDWSLNNNEECVKYLNNLQKIQMLWSKSSWNEAVM